MKAGELACLVDEIEGREIHGGQKAQADDPRKVRAGNALARVEEDRQINRRPFLRGSARRGHRNQQAKRNKPVKFKG
ncbi:hypothetical protein [Sinorhizobium sp. RAC02]|uniref:hypothetical protein n=1 Tax=Sinorhizobium sp. RAC02 TaxID=1842534 RepID=UPI00256FB65B|nr:hypothetical protein [Sinorhizobium sp. RAC02]